jgi:hypothetical protein
MTFAAWFLLRAERSGPTELEPDHQDPRRHTAGRTAYQRRDRSDKGMHASRAQHSKRAKAA